MALNSISINFSEKKLTIQGKYTFFALSALISEKSLDQKEMITSKLTSDAMALHLKHSSTVLAQGNKLLYPSHQPLQLLFEKSYNEI